MADISGNGPFPAEDVEHQLKSAEVDDLNQKSSLIDPLLAKKEYWDVSLDLEENICYALSHNRVPILNSLTIRANTAAESRKITVKFHGEWANQERSPIRDCELVLEAPTAQSAIQLSPVPELQLDDIALSDLAERANARLIIEISDDFGRRQIIERDLNVYSRNQWLVNARMRVITAAFVQPNHPDVPSILTRAAQILTTMGRKGALSGYQQVDIGQQHAIAEAIFLALQEKIGIYINPPASFEKEGQKLRPLDEVLETGQGTCIDLACAYASCLEASGLHPLIFFVRGHAFAGYLAQEGHLNTAVIDNWEEVQGYLDSGLLVGVETTAIPGKMEFAAAIAATQRHFAPGVMHGVLDVHRAHKEGINPIPARVVRDGVLTIVIDGGSSKPPVIERRDPKTRKLLPDSVPSRVQAWKSALLDLTFKNRLLNLRSDRYGISVIPPLGALGWIEDRLNNGDPLIINAADNLNAVQKAAARIAQQMDREALTHALYQGALLFAASESETFKRAASRLRNEARSQEEESGANCLYLTLGSVQWGSQYGEYSSPIFLIPIRIAPIRGLYAIQIAMDETQSTVINYCLIEALRMREQLQMQWFSDDMSDDLGLDIEAGLEALRSEFRERGLDAKGFRVDQTASLAVLDFKKFRLWKDLNDHWPEFAKRPVVKHLIETPRESFIDPSATSLPVSIDDSKVLCAQPADGSQIAAIERALSGSSFVLEGPPGTGKSQTITNLLANAMHRGKKVLFVAEKQSALQVVRERLDQVGLGPYCLDLHDRGSKPQALRDQLLQALDQSPAIDERQVAQFEDDFSAAATHLDNYRKNVYAENNAGFSFASAYFKLLELGDGPIAEVSRGVLDLPLEVIDSLRKQTLDLETFTNPARVSSWHPWSLAEVFDFSTIDRTNLGSQIQSVIMLASGLSETSGQTCELIQSLRTLQDLATVSKLLALIESAEAPATNEWTGIFASDWAVSAEKILNEIASTISSVEKIIQRNPSILRETDLSSLVAAITSAAESFVIGRKGRVKSALGKFSSVIGTDDIDVEKTVKVATDIQDASLQITKLTQELKAKPGFASLNFAFPVTQDEVLALRTRVSTLHLVGLIASIPGGVGEKLRSFLGQIGIPMPGLSAKVVSFVESLSRVAEQLHSSEKSFERWVNYVGVIQSVLDSQSAWGEAATSGTFLSLQRWINLKTHLIPFCQNGMDSFARCIETGEISGFDAAKAFERGVLTTTLQIRAEETDLDVFDSDQHNRRVRKFIELLAQRKSLAQSLIPYQLFKNRKILGGVNTGKIGEFRRELNVSKRGRGKSIRHLIQRYPEIVADLTPCFMMSPDSVAQFVTPGSVSFDLVVFDEASQITVADSIGVLGRSDACVIVGDSKQMPPSRFGGFGAAADPDAEENEERATDEESILEEALRAGFDSEMLSWHYRSQDESLISFSNDHYYESRLSTFPAPLDFRKDCGVFYRRVEGQFDHGKSRTNEIEARAIIEEITKRLDDPLTANLSIGVVTLNIQQRNLIMSMIEGGSDQRLNELFQSDDPEKQLFVLNLENVQGRERDIIILGTAFSRRATGGAMPLNFGPLTNPNGEKRLNVAVTRARKQFVVISSFDPADLSNATSLGMVHLREYLEHASTRSSGRAQVVGVPSVVSQQIKAMAEDLERRGIVVAIGRGASKFKVDLALSLPGMEGRWLVAVLVDSVEWSKRPLVVDRDALPMTILEKVMDWPRVARVWMPAWRLESERIIDDLVDLVNSAATEPILAEPVAQPQAPVFGLPPSVIEDRNSESEPQIALEALAGEEPFTPYVGMQVQDQYLLDSISPTAQKTMRDLLQTEGPLNLVYAIKRVAYLFGMQKVVEKRIYALVPLLSGFTVTEVEGVEYVWPSNKDPETWRGFSKTSADVRDISVITPYEIVNAMESVIRQSLSFDRSELSKWTCSFFGVKRATARVNEYIDECVDWAISTGRFVQDDTHITLK